MIDIHSHLLPGIDDGPRAMRDTLKMAQEAVRTGTTTMVCTPHMVPHYPGTTPDRVAALVAETRAELERAGVPLEIATGGEISLERLAQMDDGELRAASLGGNGRWLLVEMPWRGWPVRLPDILTDLEIRGFGAVLAHPERAESVQMQPSRMRDLVGRGALTQVTASSLLGEHGRPARQCAEALLRNGLVHVLASDAHSHEWRPPGMAEGLAAAAEVLRMPVEELRWMVEEGPRQILAGDIVRPPRFGAPAPTRRGRDKAAPPRRGRPRPVRG